MRPGELLRRFPVLLSLFGCLPAAMLKGPGVIFLNCNLGVRIVFLRYLFSKPSAIGFIQLVDLLGASIAGAGGVSEN